MNDVKILLRSFNLNSLKANPGKCQFMILRKSLRPKYCLTIGAISVRESGHVELLEITIDKHLSFKKPFENLCRITKYLTLEKAKLLGSAFTYSQFNYVPLIWMFCQKTLNFKIKKIHHKTLRTIHQSNVSYRDLLECNIITFTHK